MSESLLSKKHSDFDCSCDNFEHIGINDVLGLIEELENIAVRMKYEEDKHITYWVRLNDVYELFGGEK